MADDEEETECPNNVRLFRIAISHNLKSIAESVSEDEFVEILTIVGSKLAKKAHKIMVKDLYRSMHDDLEAMLGEDVVQEALIKIAKLSEESATLTDEDAWRPPGDVASHLRSVDVHTIKEATKELEKQVNEIERENETLMKTVAASRSRIRAMNGGVTKILDHAPVVLQQLEKTYQQLATCTKAIE